MRGLIAGIGAAFAVALGVARADETAERIAAQKRKAEASWALVEAGPFAHLETTHLLVYAPRSFEKRLKDLGPALEKHYALAEQALQLQPEESWPGKLTVCLFDEREPYAAFIRRVEKRRLDADEAGSHATGSDAPHAVACPPRSKHDPGVEGQAAEQIAAALMQQKAGSRVMVPDWLLSGFGRATRWRAAPADRAVRDERKQAAVLVIQGKRSARDVWAAALPADQAVVLRASLADFLAYGPGGSKLPAILAGFKPEENMDTKTTEQALEAAGVSYDRLDQTWRAWVITPR